MPDNTSPLYRVKRDVSDAMLAASKNGATGWAALASVALDAIDNAAETLVIFDTETAEQSTPASGLTGDKWAAIGAQCFPGMPVELIEKAYSDWLENDPAHEPGPFAIGAKVAHREIRSLTGHVIERREDGGELHSIKVGWIMQRGNAASSDYYSPRELEEIKP